MLLLQTMGLKEISEGLKSDEWIALNRYTDMALTLFNVLVCFLLLVSPWYQLQETAEFPKDSGCNIAKGTVICPFVSEFCGNSMTSVDNKWQTVHNLTISAVAFALFGSAIIGWEAVSEGLTSKVKQWKNANTISFFILIVLLSLQIAIFINSGQAKKPPHINDALAILLTIIAISISGARLFVLIVFMVATLEYDAHGVFGTGSYA